MKTKHLILISILSFVLAYYSDKFYVVGIFMFILSMALILMDLIAYIDNKFKNKLK